MFSEEGTCFFQYRSASMQSALGCYLRQEEAPITPPAAVPPEEDSRAEKSERGEADDGATANSL